jgi:hypothetical protein
MGETQGTVARSYLETATRRFREELASVIAEHERAGIQTARVLGEPDEYARRAVHATAPVPSEWDELAGPFLMSEGVQARLGISRQAVAAKAARRRLLRVITSDGVHLYPFWQFADTGVLAGLPEVLSLFPEEAIDGWTLAAWLRTPDPDLGAAPYEALLRGEEARVVSVARTAARSLAT